MLVPLRIDETTLPFGFARIHTTDIIDWQGSIQDPEWRGVVDAIESSLEDREGIRHDETEPEEVGDDLEASRRSIPVETAKPKRTHVSASAILAIAIVMIMLLGIFVFALRLV